MSIYRKNREWSDQFLPQLRSLIGPHLLVPSSLEQDMKQAADLVVLTGRNMTIARRVRRHGFAKQYPREFTLRSRLDSGATTEFRKVIDGWGDWMFYGHSSEDDQTIDPWWLIDLSAFRTHWAGQAAGDVHLEHGETPNGDGTHFHWFRLDSFPSSPPIQIAESSHPWPARGRVPAWPRSAAKVSSCIHKPEYMVNGKCWICKSTRTENALV